MLRATLSPVRMALVRALTLDTVAPLAATVPSLISSSYVTSGSSVSKTFRTNVVARYDARLFCEDGGLGPVIGRNDRIGCNIPFSDILGEKLFYRFFHRWKLIILPALSMSQSTFHMFT